MLYFLGKEGVADPKEGGKTREYTAKKCEISRNNNNTTSFQEEIQTVIVWANPFLLSAARIMGSYPTFN